MPSRSLSRRRVCDETPACKNRLPYVRPRRQSTCIEASLAEKHLNSPHRLLVANHHQSSKLHSNHKSQNQPFVKVGGALSCPHSAQYISKPPSLSSHAPVTSARLYSDSSEILHVMLSHFSQNQSFFTALALSAILSQWL
jgi:hypothetical protein